MNNADRPVELSEKIAYLHDKIDFVNSQVKQTGLFELKMKFIDYIDTCIERIYNLDNNKKGYQSQRIPKKY